MTQHVDATQMHMDAEPEHEMNAVHVVIDNPEKERAADYGAYTTYAFTGTENQPVQILPYNPKRKKATIVGAPGWVTNNTLGYVSVGTRAEVQVGAPKSGGFIVSSMTVIHESMSALFALPDGSHELTILVVEERYE